MRIIITLPTVAYTCNTEEDRVVNSLEITSAGDVLDMCLPSCIDGSALDPSMGMGLLEGKTTPITSFCDTSMKSLSSSDSTVQNILARVCTGCSVMVLMLLEFTI